MKQVVILNNANNAENIPYKKLHCKSSISVLCVLKLFATSLFCDDVGLTNKKSMATEDHSETLNVDGIAQAWFARANEIKRSQHVCS